MFTRSLADMTERAPEVVEAVRSLPAHTAVLDGEAIVLRPDSRPMPFQETMSRFGTQTGEPVGLLVPFFFDCLHLDGEDLLDLPAPTKIRGACAWPCPRSCVSRGLSPGICRLHKRCSTRLWSTGTRV